MLKISPETVFQAVCQQLSKEKLKNSGSLGIFLVMIASIFESGHV